MSCSTLRPWCLLICPLLSYDLRLRHMSSYGSYSTRHERMMMMHKLTGKILKKAQQ
jgi:hypothetical protein